VLALILLTAQLQPGYACEGPTHTTACHLADDDDNKSSFIEDLDVRVMTQNTATPGASSWGLSTRASGKRDGWLGLEGRWTGDGRWNGRISTGFDVLGQSPFDVRLGLFMGHVGAWESRDYRYLAIGTDVAVGATVGRLGGEYRFVGGKRPNAPGLRTEHDISLSFRILKELRAHGHWLAMTDQPGEVSSGVGLGVSWTF